METECWKLYFFSSKPRCYSVSTTQKKKDSPTYLKKSGRLILVCEYFFPFAMLSLACLFVLWQIVGVGSLLTNSLKKVQWWICTSWVQLMSWWSGWDKLLWHLTHVWIDLHFPGFVWGFWPWLWPRRRSNPSDPNRPLEALRVRPALVRFLPLARRRDCVLACMFSMTPPLWGCPLPWLWVNNFKMLASQKWLFCLLFLYNNFEVGSKVC